MTEEYITNVELVTVHIVVHPGTGNDVSSFISHKIMELSNEEVIASRSRVTKHDSIQDTIKNVDG